MAFFGVLQQLSTNITWRFGELAIENFQNKNEPRSEKGWEPLTTFFVIATASKSNFFRRQNSWY